MQLVSSRAQEFLLLRIRTCFLRRVTLKRSKSLSCFLRDALSNFFAYELFDHLLSISDASHFFLRATVPAVRGRLSIFSPVSVMLERGAAWRGTASSDFAEGPSTRI